MFLLDTNAISEPQRPRPDKGYLRWLNDRRDDELWVSALSLGELRYGVLRLDAGAKRRALEQWLAEAAALFHDRILAVDHAVAERWSALWLDNVRAGRGRAVVDELITATALVHGLTVVTRNVRHFEGSGCKVLSPWSA